MTADQRFEHDLPALLTDLAMPSVPSYRDEIVRQVEASPQRLAWTFAERWIPMETAMRRLPVVPINWRLLALAALLVLGAVAIAIVAAGANRRLPAPPYGPAVNGLIAYADHGDVYLGDPANGASRPIVTGDAVDDVPGFSRDGMKLGFLRMAPFAGQFLMQANADGSDIHKITQEPFIGLSAGDGTGDALVVASEVDGLSAMSIIDIADGSVRNLDVGMSAQDPKFRPPDGREILFVSGTRNDDLTMYVLDIAGGTPRRLALGGGPRYSPDGSQISYFVVRRQPNSEDIESVTSYVMNSDGTNNHAIGEASGIWYQNPMEWSPDGTGVLLIRGYEGNSRRTLAVVPADGSGPGVEYEVPIVGDWGPAGWSPDGRFIYFAGNEATEATLIDTLDGSLRTVPLWYASAWQRLAP